jgi:hypothetical protein
MRNGAKILIPVEWLHDLRFGPEFNFPAVAEQRKSMYRIVRIDSIFKRQEFGEPHLDLKSNS